MNKTYKTISIIFLIFCLTGIGYLIYDRPEVSGLLNFGGDADEPRDIYGTTIGTSTTPTTNLADRGYPTSANSDFSNDALSPYSTTSKAVILNGTTDTALFTFTSLTASTSGYFSWDIFGSNDTGCDTVATSTTDDDYVATAPLVSDISWHDIGSDGSRVSGSLLVSDAQYTDTGTSTSRLLTDLNWKCLRVDLRGASTTVAVQLREKTN